MLNSLHHRDRKDDYIFVGENGALYVWYNRGTIRDFHAVNPNNSGGTVKIIDSKVYPIKALEMGPNQPSKCQVKTTSGKAVQRRLRGSAEPTNGLDYLKINLLRR